MKKQIKIAEQRLEEMEERRVSFARKYKETKEELYKDLRDNEQENIDKLRVALTEAYLQQS